MPERIKLPKRILQVYFFWWMQWSIIQVFVLHHLGLSWGLSIEDSLLSNAILSGTIFTSNNILRFYQPNGKHWYFGLVWSLSVALICTYGFKAIQDYIWSHDPDYLTFLHNSVLIRFCFALLLITCSTMMSWIWNQMNELKENDSRKSEMEKLAKESELLSIRQQLQPHFLFNSLNSISALTGSKPEEARKMIQQLSDFLRGTLRKDDQQLNSLEEELKHLQLYLDIEKVRFGHRLNIEIKVDEQTKAMMLPTLLLQPIVENAIKFGLYDTLGKTTIEIHANVEGNYLVVQIQNPFDSESAKPKRGTGYGLSSVERRLYLLYGRNDLLSIKTDANLFSTFIKIPQTS